MAAQPSEPPAINRIEITIRSCGDGAAATPEEAIRALEEALRAHPRAPGDVFVFLGMEFADEESLLETVRATQRLWE